MDVLTLACVPLKLLFGLAVEIWLYIHKVLSIKLHLKEARLVQDANSAHDTSADMYRLTGALVLGLRASHCRPVSNSTAESRMTNTSARDWDELASTTGAICSTQDNKMKSLQPRLRLYGAV